MAVPSLLDRALAALDEAFSDQVKRHFAGICVQIDGDGAVKAAADTAHFQTALQNLLLAYAAARAIARRELEGAT